MSLPARIRRWARAGGGPAGTRVGDVLVVSTSDGGTPQARALAAALPADPDHDVVVADLPPGAGADAWEAVAAALGRGRRPVRLVPGRHPRELAPDAGRWLAERLGRAVVAPRGPVHQGAAGALFAHAGAGSGWVRSAPGREPVWEAKRFPRPAWESAAFTEVRRFGAVVAEPLPAGVWLRPAGDDDLFAAARVGLTRAVPCRPHVPVVVLGCPGAPDLDPADVAAFRRSLSAPERAAVWFAPFGGVARPGGDEVGQVLADHLDAEVRCLAGVPVGSPDRPDVRAVRPDGSLGWSPFAQAFAHLPRRGAEPPPPRLCAHRPPVAGLPEVSPGVHWCAPDTVVEVVRAGLWVRPAEVAGAAARTAPLDPMRNLVLYEAGDPAHVERLRAAAGTLLDRLDGATVLVSALLPTTALPLTTGAPAAGPPAAAAERGDAGSREGGQEGVQSVETAVLPVPAASPAPGADGRTYSPEEVSAAIRDRLGPGR
ncbi:hypothetical protein GCM10009660_35220 [Catellatospora bangladeshensis]